MKELSSAPFYIINVIIPACNFGLIYEQSKDIGVSQQGQTFTLTFLPQTCTDKQGIEIG